MLKTVSEIVPYIVRAMYVLTIIITNPWTAL